MIDYASTFINTSGAFPDILAINETAPGAADGTEFVAALVNDIWGRAQALMDYAGLSPDGVTEAPDTAQILEALCKGFGIGPGMGVIYWKNGAPATNGDRVLLLQGQVILIATYPLLAAAVYCGDANNATAPAFYKTSDAGGNTRSTTGAYMVLPDTRGLSLKGVGNATVNTRTKTGPASLGGVQEDAFQGFDVGAPGFEATSRLRTRGSNVYAGSGGSETYSYTVDINRSGSILLPMDDGSHGTPRIESNTRDSSIGTNFGITY